jgi:hypothetical protein
MIGILHLSDFHFRVNNDNLAETETKMDDMREAICGVVNSQTLHINTLLVIVSGDVAFSGKHEEYQIALDFFGKLKSRIEIESDLETLFVFAPGNHDNDYSLLGDETQTIDDTELPDFAKRSIIQSEFGNFSTNFGQSGIDLKQPTNCLFFNLDNLKIKIHIINSGLSSSLNPIPAGLSFPTESLIQLEKELDSVGLTISIMHHPIHSFEERVRIEIKAKVEDTTDLLFVGHEHRSDYSGISGFSDSHVNIINGEKIDIQNFSTSGLNFLRVDVDNNELNILQFLWNEDSKRFVETKNSGNKLLVNPRRKRFSKQLNTEFLKFLQDPGGPFVKQNSGEMRLQDIFVYPNLTVTSQKESSPRESIVLDESNIVEEIQKHQVTFVTGSDFSGKTSLCKKLFWDLFHSGKFPLFMQGESITSPKKDNLEKIIKKEYGKIYTHPDINSYFQEEKSNKILIVDGFEKIKLNGTRRIELLENLLNFYSNVIIMCTEEIDAQSSTTIALLNINGSKNLNCRIKPFGKVQRDQLVEKWIKSYYENHEENLLQKQIEIGSVLNDILDKNFLPAYPFFVLSILQTMETSSVDIRSSSGVYSGSYAAIYNLLITTALFRNRPSNLEMNLLGELLQKLAYKMYTEKRRRYSEEEINQFTQEFLDSRLVNVNYSSIVSHLINNRVWDDRNSSLGFAYDFIYYYYLASYFQEQIQDGNIVDQIIACVKCIGNEGNRSLVRFLIYFANPQVRNILFTKLVEKTEGLYVEVTPVDFIKQTRFISDISINLPSERLDNKPEDNRLDLMKRQDQIDEVISQNEIVEGEEEEDENYWQEQVETVNSLQLLGDLLKNQNGTLDRTQKIELVNVSFGLVSRILSSGLDFFASERELLEEQITLKLKDIDPEMTGSVMNQNTKIIFTHIIFIYTLTMLSGLRDYIGHEKLNLVFSEVRKTNGLADILLFDFTVRQHPSFHNFPEIELDNVLRQYNRCPFIRKVIAFIAYSYISLNPTDYKIKASVSKKIGVKPPIPKLIASD